MLNMRWWYYLQLFQQDEQRQAEADQADFDAAINEIWDHRHLHAIDSYHPASPDTNFGTCTVCLIQSVVPCVPVECGRE